NSSITSATITMLISRATSTSCSADSVVGVRSKIGVICTSAGNTLLSAGSAARIAFTVATALASGRLLICRVTARLPLNQAAAYLSCWPLLIVATSASRTGTPWRLAITRGEVRRRVQRIVGGHRHLGVTVAQGALRRGDVG